MEFDAETLTDRLVRLEAKAAALWLFCDAIIATHPDRSRLLDQWRRVRSLWEVSLLEVANEPKSELDDWEFAHIRKATSEMDEMLARKR